MTGRLRSAFDRLLRDERGIALVMALGVSFVLGILGASVILFTTSNERHSNRVNASTRAYTIGQAGLDTAASQLAKFVQTPPYNAPGASFFSSQTTTKSMDGGTVTWTGTPYPAGAGTRWRLEATATVPDPTNPGGTVRRVVTADAYIRPKTDQALNTDAWKYVYSKANDGDPNTCDQTIMNNPAITSSFYVNGDLCLDNSSNVYGPQNPGTDPDVDVIVRGRAYLNHPSTSLGTMSRPLTSVNVDGGCKYRSQPLTAPPAPCTSYDKVWPDSTQGAPIVTPPTPDYTQWLAQASPGPNNPCTQGSTPFSFTSGTTVDLAPASSYSCKTPMGELSWDYPNRKLTVQGTILIQGNAEFSSDGVISYEGSFGAIYLTGSYRQRQTVICGKVNVAGDACDPDNWNAVTSMIVLVTNSTGPPAQVDAGMTFEQSSAWQGALYSAGNMTFENNTWVQGPMIAERQVIQNSMYFHYIPEPARVPFGTPGTPVVEWEMGTVTNFSG